MTSAKVRSGSTWYDELIVKRPSTLFFLTPSTPLLTKPVTIRMGLVKIQPLARREGGTPSHNQR